MTTNDHADERREERPSLFNTALGGIARAMLQAEGFRIDDR